MLYRKPGEHEYKAGEDGVESVFQNCMELPYEKRVASLENLCGYYVAMFDTKCYSQVVFVMSYIHACLVLTPPPTGHV